MGIISHCRKWPVQLWFLTPRSSQCLQMLFYCMGGLIAWYFRKTEQIHLPFCMLSRKNLVVTIWLPLLHRSALDGLLCCSQHWLALVQLNTSEVLESCNIMFQAALSLGARSADKPATEPSIARVSLYWALLQPLPTLSALQTTAPAPRQAMGRVAQPRII